MAQPAGKQDAQLEVDRLRNFRSYLAHLEHQNVLELSLEQRQRLDEHLDGILADLSKRFDIDVTETQRQLSLGMRVISALGGLAFCIAVFLFFYKIWGVISTPAQVAILVAVPLFSLAATEFAALRERSLYFASLGAIVACAAFVLNLTVLGKIFNITPSQNAFLVWGIFGLALAYRYRLRIELIFGLLSLLAFISASIMTWRDCSWFTLGERPENFIAAGLLLIAIPQSRVGEKAPEFSPVYRAVGSLAVFIPVYALGQGGWLSYFPLRNSLVEHLYQILAFPTAAAAVWFGIQRHYREMVNLGSAFFAIFLLTRFVDWWWDWMPKYVFFFVVGAIALVLLAAFRKMREHMGAPA